MKRCNKIISILLSIIMTVLSISIIQLNSFAATVGTTGECTWSLNGTVLTISGNGKMEDYEYDYYGKKAPWGTLITKAIIENGVKNIGVGSFYKCKSLKELYIMGDVSTWFSPQEELDSLTNLFLGKDVTNIKNNLLFDSLENITVAEENESYSSVDGILFNKNKTKLIKYPRCKKGEVYAIPDRVISIGNNAFNGCTSLKSVTIPDSVIEIGDRAFSGANVDVLTLGKGIRSIGDAALSNSCKKLVLTGDITTNSYDGYYTDSTKALKIEKDVTKIDSRFFFASLENITVAEENESYSSIDGVLFNKDKTELVKYPSSREIETYAVPDGVKTIGYSAFGGYNFSQGNNDYIKTVTLPDSLVDIKESAFLNCTSLKKIVIPQNVTSIGCGAFRNCTSLTSLMIADSVTTIGNEAFDGCENLKEVNLGKNVVFVDYSAFKGCIYMSSITIPQDCRLGWRAFGYFDDNPIPNFTVYGYTGSDAERYATENKFTFISIGIMHKPKSLSVSKLPDKTTYYQGENFEVKGLELQLTYTDGETSTLIVSENYWNEGYSIDWNTYSIGTSTVTVSYAGLGTTFEINVIHNPDVSIGFPDVRMGDWYYDAVKYNFERGYITGYSNGTFGPSNNIQRQDFVLILARIAGADLSAYEGKNGGFSDVQAGAYYASAVAWAKDKGIVTGYSADNFGVGTYITREQISLILCRYLGGEASGDVDTILNAYPDGGNTSPWAKAGVAWAVENGIIGNSDYLNPNGNAGRAEVAQIIYNMSNKGML